VPEYSLNVTVVGSGTVTKNPNASTYDEGTQVTLTATPADGYYFAGWSGGYGTTNPLTITVNDDISITATFEAVPPEQHTVTVTVVGSGTVTKNPNASTYDEGTQVTLTATPADGYYFAGWSGGYGTTNPLTITVNSDIAITATFEALPPEQHSVNVTISGSGTVTKNPDALTYDEGSQVTLTATPADGYYFAGWSGGYGTTNPLTITVNDDISITATFEARLTLTLAASGTSSSVSFTVSPDEPTYMPGTSVTITAPDVSGYVFDGWKENGSWVTTAQSNSCTITMNSDHSLTAQYSANTTTILVYLDGDNSLSSAALYDINEMEAADLRETGITVAVLYDTDTLSGYTYTYKIQYSGSATPDSSITSKRVACSPLGITTTNTVEIDMGDPDTLDDFIDWGLSAYPAAQNMLVLWNHGSGWRSMPAVKSDSMMSAAGASINATASFAKKPAINRGLTKALCEDETSGTILFTSDLGDVIEDASFDVIGFDLCLGGMIEVAYEIRNKADYMIASEETTPGDGWEYNLWLADFAGKTSKTAYEIVDSVVDTFATRYASTTGTTMAGYDLQEIDDLYTELMSFSTALSNYIVDATTQDAVGTILYNYVEDFYSIPGDLNIDIWDMAEQIDTGISGEFTTEAAALQSAVESVVIKEWHNTTTGSSGNPRAHGIAIHFIALDDYGDPAGHDYAYFADHATLSPTTGYIPSFIDAGGNSWVPNYTAETGLLYEIWYEVF
jgi:hypothetical protein